MSHIVRPLPGRGRWATLAVALVLSTAAMARLPVGHIEGTIRDTAGAPIANAQVIVVGTAYQALSDSAGRYRLADIPVGRHTIRAAFIGYKSTQVTEVLVRENLTTTVDILLEVTAVELQ